MKHALVTLIVIIIAVLLVAPLIYIATGRIKNPVDLFALNKIQEQHTATNFISPNYIPDPGTGEPGADPYADLDKRSRECFADAPLVSGFSFNYSEATGTRSNVTTASATSTALISIRWSLDGFSLQEVPQSKVGKNYAKFVIESVSGQCLADKKTSSSLPSLFNYFVDSKSYLGKFYDPKKYSDSQRYDLVEQGVTTINARAYYWYLFEDKNRLSDDRNIEKFYYAVYGTFDSSDATIKSFLIQGSSKIFATSRDFLRKTQSMLSGVTYVSSMPAQGAVQAAPQN